MAKLTEAEVRQIKQTHGRGGASAAELARVYGLSAETVRRILRGETWTWVSVEESKTDSQLREEAAASLEKMQAMLAAERDKKDEANAAVEELAGLSPEAQERLKGYR